MLKKKVSPSIQAGPVICLGHLLFYLEVEETLNTKSEWDLKGVMLPYSEVIVNQQKV